MDINFDKPPKSQSPIRSNQGAQKPGTADPMDQTAQVKKAALPDRGNISDRSKEIADIIYTVSLLPEVREAKVREIKANIYTGDYAVDPRKVAESILKNL
jgi:flagellar biosynthesis anti-sigma factor FlgM